MRGRLIARQPAQDHRLNHALAKIVGKTHPRRPHSRSVNEEAEINRFGNPPTNSIRSDTALKELDISEFSFRDLPLYSHDYYADYPQVAREFKRTIAEKDAILFVTAEFNRSIPGALKNAIDWASRPYGTNAFTRKPTAVIGASIGAIGAAVAQQSLRSVLSFCNAPQMNAPEAYIHFTPGLITDNGEVTEDATAKFLRNYMAEFHAFIIRVRTVLPWEG